MRRQSGCFKTGAGEKAHQVSELQAEDPDAKCAQSRHDWRAHARGDHSDDRRADAGGWKQHFDLPLGAEYCPD